MAKERRQKIPRAPIVQISGRGVDVDAKKCTICGIVKSLDEFNRQTTGSGGRQARCRQCRRDDYDKIRCGPPLRTRWEAETYRSHVEEMTSGDYVVVGDYAKGNIKITHWHSVCRKFWDVLPNSFLQGRRCPHCNGHQLKSPSQFMEEVKSLEGGDEYTVIGKYAYSRTKIKMRHDICGAIWWISPNHFLRGQRCPECNESKGEHRIADVLSRHRLHFERQYKIPECRSTRPLPFDFALFEDGRLTYLIEYDGEQHFYARWGGESELRKVQHRDSIKTDYCRRNNIPLLRIKFTEYESIGEVLTLHGIINH